MFGKAAFEDTRHFHRQLVGAPESAARRNGGLTMNWHCLCRAFMNLSEPAPPADGKPQRNPTSASSVDGAPETKPRRPRWLVWARLVIYGGIILLLVAIAIPNFVKARTTKCKSACIANLRQIDGAVEQWALENKKQPTDTVTMTDIRVFMKVSALPQCPAGGTYSVSTVSAAPLCTGNKDGDTGHRLE